MQQEEEVKYRKAHKACTTNEPHVKCTQWPSTSRTDHIKMPSERTTKHHEQWPSKEPNPNNSKWLVTLVPPLVQHCSQKSPLGNTHFQNQLHKWKLTNPRCRHCRHCWPIGLILTDLDTIPTNVMTNTATKGTNHLTRTLTYLIAVITIATALPLRIALKVSRHANLIPRVLYEEGHHHTFGHSPPKLTDYISPLHSNAEVQHRLEVLKNPPPQPEFKTPLAPALPMDIEQSTTTKSDTAMTIMTSLPTIASTRPPSTTVTSMLATTPVTMTTTASQPTLVMTTAPVLGAIPPASTVLCAMLQLPSQVVTLPNYICFRTTYQPHTITLCTPHFPPRIDPNIEFFLQCTRQEMVLINFLVDWA
uniref:Uncharacterized protein n=1 Tax=Romanomermis culicivorax TaxID=13658 RepID=A0A915JYC3_ROMCU